MVYAQVSKTCGGNPMRVQFPLSAQKTSPLLARGELLVFGEKGNQNVADKKIEHS